MTDTPTAPRPLSEAPRDGTAILTDSGFVCWTRGTYWARNDGWAICTSNGSTYECADNGPFWCCPTQWLPLHDWMRG